MARDDAYGQLPEPNASGSYRLSTDYIRMATQDVAVQLSKAGVRLALTLNRALGPTPTLIDSPRAFQWQTCK